MAPQFIGVWAWMLVAPAPLQTRFEQLAPPPAVAFDGDAPARRRPDITRAVILLHGLRPQPLSAAAAARAEPSCWETPEATIVKAVSHDSDVYAFHYAQTAPLDDIARAPSLGRAVRDLR